VRIVGLKEKEELVLVVSYTQTKHQGLAGDQVSKETQVFLLRPEYLLDKFQREILSVSLQVSLLSLTKQEIQKEPEVKGKR